MGLHDGYEAEKSQILIMDPFQSLHNAYSMLQQIEKQREVLVEQPLEMANYPVNGKNPGNNVEGKKNKAKYPKCNSNKHTKENCWKINGYPEWHPRFKKKGKRFSQTHNTSGNMPRI